MTGALQQQQRQQLQQQNQLTMLMTTMEIPLLQPLPQTPSLTYCVPSQCRDTEHAAAAALCLSGNENVLLDSRLMLLLHRSQGVVPHASHFIAKHPVCLPSDDLKGVMLPDSPAAHRPQAVGGDDIAVQRDVVGEILHHEEMLSPVAVPVVSAPKSFLAKKHVMVARKLQSAVASQRRKIEMMSGISWGERMCLQQFCECRLMDVPFTARIVHSSRILACFYISGNLCTVDSEGWIKWCAFLLQSSRLRTGFILLLAGTAQTRLGSCLCAGCSKRWPECALHGVLSLDAPRDGV